MIPGHIEKPLNIYDIAGFMREASHLVFTPSNIGKGFNSTYFHPLNEIIYIVLIFCQQPILVV